MQRRAVRASAWLVSLVSSACRAMQNNEHVVLEVSSLNEAWWNMCWQLLHASSLSELLIGPHRGAVARNMYTVHAR